MISVEMQVGRIYLLFVVDAVMALSIRKTIFPLASLLPPPASLSLSLSPSLSLSSLMFIFFVLNIFIAIDQLLHARNGG